LSGLRNASRRQILMERYCFLAHTADGKFRAFGATLEEAFANAALATASLMWDWSAVDRPAEIAVDIVGRDAEQVLVKFLNEILYLFETRHFLLAVADGLKIGPAGNKAAAANGSGEGLRLTAVLRGDFLSDRYGLHGDIKAVTYNDMKIEAGEAGGFVVQVVVDL
jgi:SHS2 domain-containing protein